MLPVTLLVHLSTFIVVTVLLVTSSCAYKHVQSDFLELVT